MNRFQPIGGISKAEQAYRALRDTPTDSVIQWRDMPFEREAMYTLKEKLAKRFEAEQQRTIASERGEGWRIVAGVAQVELADRDRRLSVRRMRRGLHRVATVDYREMSGEERQRADDTRIRIQVAAANIQNSGRKLGLEAIKAWQGTQR